ncbi:MAG: glycerol-3-phosphate dehydrogenase/oxidase [Rhodoferax sp.]|nr:glycerol-3-phosphate dehydrogenase/oxidase [Rhodoferax sp.]
MSPTTDPLPTRRQDLLDRLARPQRYDLAVVGGGATGLGVALDAAARGLSVVLLESHDFAQGTSSRATKLVHGGVRYLAQGKISLVREALRERAALLANAPHLAQPLPFVLPCYRAWELPFYGIGLRVYDLLAGRRNLGASAWLGPRAARAALPQVRAQGLVGAIRYWDGQFDDARLALALARTAARQGALLINHMRVLDLRHGNGRVDGLLCEDAISGQRLEVRAGCVVNATGVWVDALWRRDRPADPAGEPDPAALVSPSQGVHLVVDRSFLGGDSALMVPRTQDGRVLFAVPWLGHLVLGTTDTPSQELAREPCPLAAEIDFILGEAARYLQRAPTRADVRSVWVGLRPLVRPASGAGQRTQALSREHTVLVGSGGLVTVTGGKWTTYRAMAEDVLRTCMREGLLPERPAGVTQRLRLLGSCNSMGSARSMAAPPGWEAYGDEVEAVRCLPGADTELAPGLTEAMVRFAARHEYALRVDDVLARRSRWLFLDAARAVRAAPRVAEILRQETGIDPGLADFQALAQRYLDLPAA